MELPEKEKEENCFEPNKEYRALTQALCEEDVAQALKRLDFQALLGCLARLL